MIKILIVDDHAVVRQGMRSLFEAEKDFEVVGEAGDGFEAIRLVEKLKPDILLLDLMLDGLNGELKPGMPVDVTFRAEQPPQPAAGG